MTASKGINPVPVFKDKHFMLHESFKKQEVVIGSFEESFKTEPDIFKPLRKKKKKNKEKSRSGVFVFISKTLVIKKIRRSSFSRGFRFRCAQSSLWWPFR